MAQQHSSNVSGGGDPQSSNAGSRRILVAAFVASILVVLGIASAVYWRMHHEHAVGATVPITSTAH